MTITTPASALVPASYDQFQRAPESELRYGFFTRLADSWAGWRDRRVVDMTDGRVDSPWLQRLHFECDNRLEAEHRSAQASLALLDHAIVSDRHRITSTATMLAALTEQRELLLEEEPSSEPTTAAEVTDDPTVRRNRRERTRLVRLADLDRRTTEAEAIRTAAEQSVVTLVASRHAHWSVVQVRGSHLIAHYNRRAATYVRTATRKHGGRVITPTVAHPVWLGEPVPSLPDFDREEH